MKNIIDRLEEYMNIRGLNDNQITIQAGLSVGLIGKARISRKGLHSESIEKILYAYKDINPEWFLIGIGEMLKSQANNTSSVVVASNSCSICAEKDKVIETLQQMVKTQADFIECLKAPPPKASASTEVEQAPEADGAKKKAA
ncbi:MAG: hypothetical protein HC896_16050 [Bacteroidales bacterium]|nr:hypothetical protein [Bacteroidales bacterium]